MTGKILSSRSIWSGPEGYGKEWVGLNVRLRAGATGAVVPKKRLPMIGAAVYLGDSTAGNIVANCDAVTLPA